MAQPGPWQPVKQARQARQAQRTVMVGMREWWAYSSLRRLTRSIHRPRTWGGRRGWEGRRWYVCVGWKVEVMRRRTGAAAVAPCRCPASPRLLPENRGAPADPRSPPCNQPAHAVVARSVSHTHTHTLTHCLSTRCTHTAPAPPPPPPTHLHARRLQVLGLLRIGHDNRHVSRFLTLRRVPGKVGGGGGAGARAAAAPPPQQCPHNTAQLSTAAAHRARPRRTCARRCSLMRSANSRPSRLSSAISMSRLVRPISLSRTHPPAQRSVVPRPACGRWAAGGGGGGWT